jgi:hypothetical protein
MFSAIHENFEKNEAKCKNMYKKGNYLAGEYSDI